MPSHGRLPVIPSEAEESRGRPRGWHVAISRSDGSGGSFGRRDFSILRSRALWWIASGVSDGENYTTTGPALRALPTPSRKKGTAARFFTFNAPV